MKLYHRTYHHQAIMERGFRDGQGNYMTGDTHRGVWVSDRPLDSNEGAHGDVILTIEAPESEIAPFEWVEEGKTYREFLVPADILNRFRVAELCLRLDAGGRFQAPPVRAPRTSPRVAARRSALAALAGSVSASLANRPQTRLWSGNL